ncbi:MAG: hypothetical protein MJB57_03860 [Gemmatimonadetes bacterium]|nr:hypothetical protein [Gemmatimonadota bacterium]
MSVEGLVFLLAIAIIFGSIGESLAGFSAGNFLVRTGVAFIGAVMGRWLPTQFNMPTLQSVTIDGAAYPVVWCVALSALFVAVAGAMWGEKTH